MEPASEWVLRKRRLDFDRLPKLMGILNVTPDSFSDGGKFFSIQAAVDQGLRLEDEGADILDIGGESTRPFSLPVEDYDEIHRVVPVIERLVERVAIPISIDTMKASVAQAALELGTEIVNDVSGLEHDPQMIEVVRRYQAGVCAMHMQGTPQTMQVSPHYDDVVDEVDQYLGERLSFLTNAGIDSSRICLDPGIGFGKTHEHNIELLRNCRRFHRHGRPLLIGHSRKGFIGKLIQDKNADRTFGTLGVSLALARQSIQILRVHDVAATKQALILFEASGGISD